MSEVKLTASQPMAEPLKPAKPAQYEAEPRPSKADADEAPALPADSQDMQAVVAQLNDHLQNVERTLNFQLDEDSGRTIVRVYDKQSNELIRQFPSEEALKLAQNLKESEPFGLFSAQV